MAGRMPDRWPPPPRTCAQVFSDPDARAALELAARIFEVDVDAGWRWVAQNLARAEKEG